MYADLDSHSNLQRTNKRVSKSYPQFLPAGPVLLSVPAK